jgi:hypothetical protein
MQQENIEDTNNPDVSLSIEKDKSGKFKQAVLSVSKNDIEKKFIFSHSAKPTRYYANESMEWDDLKAEIDKTNKQIEEQRQSRSKQTNKQTDKINNECYHYHIRIFGNKCAVKLDIMDCFSPNNYKNNAKCFYIEPFDELKIS